MRKLILVAVFLACASNASMGLAQTTITNCQTLPFGWSSRTHCTSNTFDPWPAIRENQRIWEKFSRDMDDVAMKVQERLLINKVQKLEEELLQKQKEQLNNASGTNSPAPRATVGSNNDDAKIAWAVKEQCRQGYLGAASYPGKDPNTSNPYYIWFRDNCRKLGYWKASVEEVAQARQKAEYFQGMCQLSFQHAEFEKLPRDTSGPTVSFWDTFPKAFLLKEEVCQPWGFWNAGEGAAR